MKSSFRVFELGSCSPAFHPSCEIAGLSGLVPQLEATICQLTCRWRPPRPPSRSPLHRCTPRRPLKIHNRLWNYQQLYHEVVDDC
ncbi:hypothetical protein FQN60_006447 [Etheostoma spectabile]|uniref:Uncharacterized protein n=1 Tax=Etheostoma spectabile TaxID=54343 RepID=A0A5J5CQ74_9PERO|nr:hypothetical protein FQN60_006447 [Etheostoma spectabile]